MWFRWDIIKVVCCSHLFFAKMADLAQSVERMTAEREVAGSFYGWPRKMAGDVKNCVVLQMSKEIVSSLSPPLCTTICNFKTINQSKFRVKRIDSWPSYTEAYKIAHAGSTCLCLAPKTYTLTLKMEHRMESSVFLYVCLRKAAWRHKNGS